MTVRDAPSPVSVPVALVAGASRGVGRGVARALAAAGFRVVVTARSSEAGPRADGRLESVEEAARDILAAGGDAHPYRCDHTSEREIDGLVAWMLRRFGRIDVAVLATWSGNEGYDGTRYPDGSTWGTPYWRRPAGQVGRLLEGGFHAGFLTSRAVAPVMVAAGRGLIVHVCFDSGDVPAGDLPYALAQGAIRDLARVSAVELAPHGVTALALSPGFVRTERVRDMGLGGATTESPLYAGRAVAALAGDPDVGRFAGRCLFVADLARLYGFTDEDGTQPARFVPISDAPKPET